MNIHVGSNQLDLVSAPQTHDLIKAHYETLKSIARTKRRRAKAGETLQTTDLLHESWLKIRHAGDWENEAHFLKTAAIAMRHVIIDYSRKKLRVKHGGHIDHKTYEDVADSLPEFKESPEDIVAIGDLLSQLNEVNPRYMAIVDLRYFGGYTEKETADILGITDRTVRRDWVVAKAWLASEMS